jgi:hypothetical protein
MVSPLKNTLTDNSTESKVKGKPGEEDWLR